MATIKEVKESLNQLADLQDPAWKDFEADSRAGVQAAIASRKKAIEKERVEEERLQAMLRYETEFYQQGYDFIAGIDEVGRGPLAGPVVAAAVILPVNHTIKGLNDSKKIPKKQHQAIYDQVMNQALAVGLGIMDHDVIDRVNIYEATKLAMLEAINQLPLQPQALLIDAMKLDVNLPQLSIIKGDANSLSIAAASIVAKVTRDRLMVEYDQRYPGYDFAQNAGYGTANHLQGLRDLGITPIHRKTFEPIKSMVEETYK